MLGGTNEIYIKRLEIKIGLTLIDTRGSPTHRNLEGNEKILHF